MLQTCSIWICYGLSSISRLCFLVSYYFHIDLIKSVLSEASGVLAGRDGEGGVPAWVPPPAVGVPGWMYPSVGSADANLMITCVV